MGWDRNIGAEAQEVAFVGLFILSAVRDRAHTAHWQQRLTGAERFRGCVRLERNNALIMLTCAGIRDAQRNRLVTRTGLVTDKLVSKFTSHIYLRSVKTSDGVTKLLAT